MNGNKLTNGSTAPLGLFLGLGLIFGAWILGSQIKATRLSDRYVTVKGLVERQVKSDLALTNWLVSAPLATRRTGTLQKVRTRPACPGLREAGLKGATSLVAKLRIRESKPLSERHLEDEKEG